MTGGGEAWLVVASVASNSSRYFSWRGFVHDSRPGVALRIV